MPHFACISREKVADLQNMHDGTLKPVTRPVPVVKKATTKQPPAVAPTKSEKAWDMIMGNPRQTARDKGLYMLIEVVTADGSHESWLNFWKAIDSCGKPFGEGVLRNFISNCPLYLGDPIDWAQDLIDEIRRDKNDSDQAPALQGQVKPPVLALVKRANEDLKPTPIKKQREHGNNGYRHDVDDTYNGVTIADVPFIARRPLLEAERKSRAEALRRARG